MAEPFTHGDLGPKFEPGYFSRFSGGFFRGGQGGPKIFGLFKCIFFHHKRYVAAVAAVAIGIKVYNLVKTRNLRKKWAEAGKDVVVLHTAPRGFVHPCPTPFAVKLETFFRMAGIKYELDFEMPMGPKNKVPWITLNGEDFTDSELIIQELQHKLKKYPDEQVPETLLAQGVAMQVMLEEYVYWGVVHWRYIEDNLRGLREVYQLPPYFLILVFFFKKNVRQSLYMQGLGRHSHADMNRLMKRCMKALSVFLGEKPFLLGDKPQVVDCSVFAMVSQILDNLPRSHMKKWIDEEFPNLRAYSDRMKAKFWPDWNQVVTKPDLAL